MFHFAGIRIFDIFPVITDSNWYRDLVVARVLPYRKVRQERLDELGARRTAELEAWRARGTFAQKQKG